MNGESYRRLTTYGENESVRVAYVNNWIDTLSGGNLLDVGAGNMPFKNRVESQGVVYTSHDFELYTGHEISPGLHTRDWNSKGHDIISDITDLPKNSFEYVLLTEVLEHVPNPVKALASASESLKVGGLILVTVPFNSRMHQSPFWFSAGLSPYWFKEHTAQLNLEILDLVVVGDFVDVAIQETPLLLEPLNRGLRVGNIVVRFLKYLSPWLRKHLSKELLESGGQGVFCVAQKKK